MTVVKRLQEDSLILSRRWLYLIGAAVIFFQLCGCARLWRPFLWAGKNTNPEYFARPVYYHGTHPLCQYQGPHIHDSKLGPVSVTEKDPKVIAQKYRYPGMEDDFQELDQRW